MHQQSLTIRPACVQKYGFAISPSAFAVSALWQVLWHALLYILQVCTYKFREGYIGNKLSLLTV